MNTISPGKCNGEVRSDAFKSQRRDEALLQRKR